MKHFCDNCHNLLTPNTSSGTLVFKCLNCMSSYNSDADDTLRYSESKDGNLVIFQTIINKAKDGPATLKTRIKCPKCSNHIAKQVRLGNELRLINICEKCGFQWIET